MAFIYARNRGIYKLHAFFVTKDNVDRATANLPWVSEYLLTIDIQYDYLSYVCTLKGIVSNLFFLHCKLISTLGIIKPVTIKMHFEYSNRMLNVNVRISFDKCIIKN